MPMIVLGKGRDKDLGLEVEKMNKRMESNDEKLDAPIEALAGAMSEGQTMAFGLEFPNGAQLASYIESSVKFCIAALMEQGHLAKTLPKAKKKAAGEPSVGQYL